jgi:hypothetical protein
MQTGCIAVPSFPINWLAQGVKLSDSFGELLPENQKAKSSR